VANQQAQQLTEDTLRLTNKMVLTPLEDARELLKRTLDDVRSNTDISDKARASLSLRLEQTLGRLDHLGTAFRREGPDDVWTLDFKFKDPRLIKVNIPGKGQKLCWYLWYQVKNDTREPRTFIPQFELVRDGRNTVHPDQVLPTVEEAIREVEDPANLLKIKNSVTITNDPIPVSRPGAQPRAVTGVAIWDDVAWDAPRLTLFVSGLSNGWSVAEPVPPDTQPVLRRKTLQLEFKRVDGKLVFVPPSRWVYRPAAAPVRGADKPARPGADQPRKEAVEGQADGPRGKDREHIRELRELLAEKAELVGNLEDQARLVDRERERVRMLEAVVKQRSEDIEALQAEIAQLKERVRQIGQLRAREAALKATLEEKEGEIEGLRKELQKTRGKK
jgi:hypothetical protein